MTGQPSEDLNENFGGTAVGIQVPTGFDAQQVATGLTAPTAIEFAPNGDMFITERGGTGQAQGRRYRRDQPGTRHQQ